MSVTLEQCVGTLAYIYGYPIVTMEQLRASDLNNNAPLNTMYYTDQLSTQTYSPFITPNADTLYATAWLDLSLTPIILQTPANTANRYYSVQLLDIYTNTFYNAPANIFSNQQSTYIIYYEPNGNLFCSDDYTEIIAAPTRDVFLVLRVEVMGTSDLDNAIALEKQITINELFPTSPVSLPPLIPQSTFTSLDFFSVMVAVMQRNPPPLHEKAFVDQFKLIGIDLSVPFNVNSLNPTLVDLIPNAFALISIAVQPYITFYNNWGDISVIGTYKDYYIPRAYIALAGLAANIKQREFYLRTKKASDGTILTGANNYTIHFNVDQLPQTSSFWSLDMYQGNNLVPNPINRYSLGTNTNDLQFNPDGSLDIFIQQNQPANGTTNWLPAPAGDFNITIRMYLATEQQINNPSNIPGIINLGPVA